jgi:hypothetical protein
MVPAAQAGRTQANALLPATATVNRVTALSFTNSCELGSHTGLKLEMAFVSCQNNTVLAH